MNNPITNFAFEEMLVRVIIRDGEPWFVLNDVCRVLDIKQSHHAAARLDDDEKDRAIITTLGGDQATTIINESGLYSLILTSRKEDAKKFKKWVTSEVLPSIRRTGSYNPPQGILPAEDFGIDPELIRAPLSARVEYVNLVVKMVGRNEARAVMPLLGLGNFAGVADAARRESGKACLAHIMAFEISVGVTVADHIGVAMSADDPIHPPLWELGLRVAIDAPAGLQVATNAALVRKLFENSEWSNGRHAAALRALPGAYSGKNQKFSGRMQSTVIFIPLELLGGRG